MRSMKRDPAPSRFAFRVKRLWRSARFRRSATVYAPALALGGFVAWAAMQAEWRDLARAKLEETRARVAAMEEFAIKRIEIAGASAEGEARLRALLADLPGASSMRTDAAVIRARVEREGWVETARVRLAAPETLHVAVTERVPAAIWRHGGALTLIDAGGAAISALDARGARPDLPLVAGAGADAAVAEARAILAEAGALAAGVRGLVRVGERRWDMIFAEGPKVLLPEQGAVDAVAYLVIMQAGRDVFSRDVEAIDLRLMARPTLRLGPDARDALDAARAPRKPGEDA